MKKSVAEKHLVALQYAYQKARSILREGDMPEDMLKFMNPWIFGKKCPLGVIAKMLDDQGFTPMDYFNQMAIATRFEPSVAVLAAMQDETFPKETDVNWLRGWEYEDQSCD